MVRSFKNGGGGGRTVHSVPLPGGCSDRAAPAGGCPRQGPASVVSSAAARVSPRPPSLKVRGCAVPESREFCPRGGVGGLGNLPRPSGAPVFSKPGGGTAARGEVRTGAGPLCSLPLQPPRRHPRPLNSPPPRARRDAPRGSYNFPETSAGAGKLQRVPAPRIAQAALWPVAGRAAEECVMGAFSTFPGSDGARPTPALRAVSRARPGAPAGAHTSAGRPGANSTAAVSEGAVGDAAVRGCIWPGRGGVVPRLGTWARVLRRGRRSLTFPALALDWGHREPQSDPSE